ncbi:MAG TPA: MFS transporter, partial [Candidatus Baltobacteraceae bacterium]|nr:MFS transporter [Candidatus Baltobacteraceae bacterium]
MTARAEPAKNVWVAFTLLSATFFMLIVDFSIVSIALPSMESELHMTAAQGQWIVSTYAIFLAGFLMLTGRCADLFGRFRFFVAGLTIFTLASLVGGLSQSGAMLITMRALQGLGAALVNPAALAIVLSLFPPGPQRSRAIALWGTAGSLGVAAGMLFGGILVQYLGWRAVLWVNVPVAIVIASLVAHYVPRDSGASQRSKLDVTGALLLTAGLITFVYAIESIPANGAGSPVSWLAFAVAVGLFVAFAAVERRAAEPILPSRLFRYPDLVSGAAVVMLQPASYAGVMVFASVYLQQVSGYSPLAAGMAFLPEAFFISFVAAPLTMPIVRLFGVKTMGIATGLLMVAGEVILLFIQPHSPYWAILLPATCLGGFGGMLAYQSGMIAGLAHVDDADEGSASAAMSFALQLGIGLGVAVGAAAQDLVSPPLEAGLHAAFWVTIAFGAFMMLAILFGLRHAAKAELPSRRYI